MNNKNVLVISNKLNERNSLSKWIGGTHPFNIDIVNDDETAIERCHVEIFDIVVVDGTDTHVNGRKLNAVLPILQDELTILKYQ